MKHQPAEGEIEDEHQREPESADGELSGGRVGTDPVTREPRDEEDEKRSGDDADLARAMIAHVAVEESDSQDALRDFGGGDDQPDEERVEDHDLKAGTRAEARRRRGIHPAGTYGDVPGKGQ